MYEGFQVSLFRYYICILIKDIRKISKVSQKIVQIFVQICMCKILGIQIDDKNFTNNLLPTIM